MKEGLYMTGLQKDIREKRNIMRELYGGMMSLRELSREVGLNHKDAKAWAAERGIGVLTGKRVKYETDQVAKLIVLARGMAPL